MFKISLRKMKSEKVASHKRAGFTIIEFVIIIGLMAIASGVLAPMFYSSQETAKESKAKAEVDAIASALRGYFSDKGDLVTVAAGADDSAKMDVLVDAGYLPETKTDPWGTAYVISITAGTKDSEGAAASPAAGKILDDYGRPYQGTEVYARSLGKDKATGGGDDVTIYVLNVPVS